MGHDINQRIRRLDWGFLEEVRARLAFTPLDPPLPKALPLRIPRLHVRCARLGSHGPRGRRAERGAGLRVGRDGMPLRPMWLS